MSGATTTTAITHVGTIGIPVSDQDRALEFYVGTLGFEKRLDVRYGESARWVDVAPPGATTTIALVRTSESNKVGIDTQIRLMTGDAAALRRTPLARGVAGRPRDHPGLPCGCSAFRDPDGNRLVVVEYARWPSAPAPHKCATLCVMSDRATNPRVGVRELRQNLSVYLDRVKDGETLEVTEHGHPVAR